MVLPAVEKDRIAVVGLPGTQKHNHWQPSGTQKARKVAQYWIAVRDRGYSPSNDLDFSYVVFQVGD